MTSNVGTTDRVIRIVLGVILIALGLSHVVTGRLAIAAYVVGAIALVTGVFRYCPAWSVFGINTCPLKAGQNK
ncbi:MAG: DUF2892 domain-containing protein [Candidatus Acidiferrum sp.]